MNETQSGMWEEEKNEALNGQLEEPEQPKIEDVEK